MLGANLRLHNVLRYLRIDSATLCQRDFSALDCLSLDSRAVNASTLFLAISGSHTSGHQYIDMAAKSGCSLAFLDTAKSQQHGMLEERRGKSEYAISCLFVHDLQQKLADIAYCFYTGNNTTNQSQNALPSITAVTGTNGKTSVASLMAQLSSLCHEPSASIGTLGVNLFTKGAQQKLSETINTTPDIISLVTTLATLQKRGCTSVMLEASSHGLAQDRLSKLKVGCGVFTNLTQDHLDYHGSMASYGQAKRLLLKAQGLNEIVLNADDDESLKWQVETFDEQAVYWFSLHGLSAKRHGCWASEVNYSTQGISFMLHARFPYFNAQQRVTGPLIGAFNVANLLAAVTALLAQGFSFAALVDAVSSISAVAGRMELFTSTKASVLVDYAHTPDALKQALLAARVHTQGKLICIFGCGGNRDSSKRVLMGRIAKQYADSIVLTQDNSRNEKPSTIIADIQKGLHDLAPHQSLIIELDREKAICQTWQASSVGDIILVAGKGHEDYLEINNQRIDYNERNIVRRLTSANAPRTNTSSAQSSRDPQ